MSATRIKKKKNRTQVVGQWFEIEVVNGATKTTAYPDNEEVEKMIAKKEEATGRPVELVYRRLNFLHGVPEEYHWTTDNLQQREFGGMGIQRLRVEDWRRLIVDEAGGHLKCSEFHMPRPQSRGGCECEACRDMASRIHTEVLICAIAKNLPTQEPERYSES